MRQPCAAAQAASAKPLIYFSCFWHFLQVKKAKIKMLRNSQVVYFSCTLFYNYLTFCTETGHITTCETLSLVVLSKRVCLSMIVRGKKMKVYLFTNDIKQHYIQLKRQEDSLSLHVERQQWGAGTAGGATAAAAARAAADAAAARAADATAARAADATAARAAVAAADARVAAVGRGRLRPRSVVGRHWSLLVDIAVGGRGRRSVVVGPGRCRCHC